MGFSVLSFGAYADSASDAEVSFLEYLGMMVAADEEGLWLDPLDLDNDLLLKDAKTDQSQKNVNDRPVERAGQATGEQPKQQLPVEGASL